MKYINTKCIFCSNKLETEYYENRKYDIYDWIARICKICPRPNNLPINSYCSHMYKIVISNQHINYRTIYFNDLKLNLIIESDLYQILDGDGECIVEVKSRLDLRKYDLHQLKEKVKTIVLFS